MTSPRVRAEANVSRELIPTNRESDFGKGMESQDGAKSIPSPIPIENRSAFWWLSGIKPFS